MTGSNPQFVLRRIVSGGQTGVDRGALDAAIQVGLEHGGWCPQGRRAEDGVIPLRYQLAETESSKYPVRTRQNIVASDATLILYRDRLHSGTELTYRLARELGKPFLLVDLAAAPDATLVLNWMIDAQVQSLNVAGPRESSAPGIARQTTVFLTDCLTLAARNA